MKAAYKPAPDANKFSYTKWVDGHYEFVAWWKRHAHSGFMEDGEGKWHWTIDPHTAHMCDRYYEQFKKRFKPDETKDPF